jgi:glycosyltransferase involved in cell wall biosynthesis
MSQFARVSVVDNEYIDVAKWRDMYAKFASLGLNLAICPLPENQEFFHCKSELKFIEAGAMGVPLLASRMAQFDDFIVNNSTGFFASSPEEFADKIVFLVRNPAEASWVGERARKLVEDSCLAEARSIDLEKKLMSWYDAIC